MAKFLMAWNREFQVQSEINPWMVGNKQQVNPIGAVTQWEQLVSTLYDCGASLSFMDVNDKSVPDIVFTANAGLVINGRVLVSNFRHQERKREQFYDFDYFTSQLFGEYKAVTVTAKHATFEGAGDALLDNKGRLFMGFGFRSSLEAKQEIELAFPEVLVRPLQLVDPRFYHLDTCFCPLEGANGETAVMYYPGAFDDYGNYVVHNCFDSDKIIELTEDEAVVFTCNAVQVKNNMVLSECSTRVEKELEKLGLKVRRTPLGEFMKSGGQAKCLTLRTDQTFSE